jgi:hypothetical protein
MPGCGCGGGGCCIMATWRDDPNPSRDGRKGGTARRRWGKKEISVLTRSVYEETLTWAVGHGPWAVGRAVVLVRFGSALVLALSRTAVMPEISRHDGLH